MERSTTQRDSAQIKKVWQQLYSQLLDHKSWESSGDSLYASSSLTVGIKQKKFAQVILLTTVYTCTQYITLNTQLLSICVNFRLHLLVRTM